MKVLVAHTIENHVHLLSETVIPLKKINDHLPLPIGPHVIQRWMREGVRGAQLETAVFGKIRVTSKEAIQRFLHALNSKPETAQSQARPSMSQRDVEAGRKRFGLPKGGKSGIKAEV